MMMALVIPDEEAAAEYAGLAHDWSRFLEFHLVFQGLEVGLREAVVVRSVWSAVRLDHAEIGEHQGHCLHGTTAICMQGQLVGRHCVFCHGVFEECFELDGTFRMLDAPADDSAAEGVEDDIEIEVRPFHRPHEFCDVTGPYRIGPSASSSGI